MKILLVAWSCHPTHGSESHVGWNALKIAAEKHEVWVLTSKLFKEDCLQCLADGRLGSNVHFIFAGKPVVWLKSRLLARLQSWLEYLSWLRSALAEAKIQHGVVNFDLVHHATLTAWRVPTPFWKLGIPTLWGPVGGVANFPLSFLPTLSCQACLFELARSFFNLLSGQLPQLKESILRCTRVLVCNAETKEAFQSITQNKILIEVLPPNSLSDEKIQSLKMSSGDKPDLSILRLFAGGNMIGSKGVALALKALSIAKKRGLKFKYTVAGGGPEYAYLKKLSQKLCLENEVVFSSGLFGSDYVNELKSSHIFFMPSFRENAPVTLIEAMAAGCVPVIVKASAQGEIVSSALGIAVPVSSVSETTEHLALGLLALQSDPARWKVLSAACMDWIWENRRYEFYKQGMLDHYQQVVETGRTHIKFLI